MNLKAKRTICIVVGAASILTIVSAISYSFFVIKPEYENQTATLTTANLILRFADNDNGINATMSFGDTVTKKFLIENTGSTENSLSLDWKNLFNNYIDGSLTYTLSYSKSETGPYEEIISKSNVPVSTELLTQTLAGELSVPAKKTYFYILDITLNNLPDIDQTSDLSAIFNTSFDVNQPLKYRQFTLEIDLNGGTIGQSSATEKVLLKNGETIEIQPPTKTGYTFMGWDLNGDATFEDGILKMGLSNAKISARWEKIPLSVEYITLSSSTINLYINSSPSIAKLDFTISPENATYEQIKWSSLDTSVAIIDDTGVITSIGQGTTSVILEIDGVTASATVTVTTKETTINPMG